MLTVTIKPGELLFIGDDIELFIHRRSGDQYAVSINAPGLKVLRESAVLKKEALEMIAKAAIQGESDD